MENKPYFFSTPFFCTCGKYTYCQSTGGADYCLFNRQLAITSTGTESLYVLDNPTSPVSAPTDEDLEREAIDYANQHYSISGNSKEWHASMYSYLAAARKYTGLKTDKK